MKVKIKCEDYGVCATSAGVSIVDEDGRDLTGLAAIAGVTVYINPHSVVEAEIAEFDFNAGIINKSKHEASLDLEGVMASVSLDLVEKLAAAHGYQLTRKASPEVIERQAQWYSQIAEMKETQKRSELMLESLGALTAAIKEQVEEDDCDEDDPIQPISMWFPFPSLTWDGEEAVDLADQPPFAVTWNSSGASFTYPATSYDVPEPEAADPDKAKRDAIAKATKAICGG